MKTLNYKIGNKELKLIIGSIEELSKLEPRIITNKCDVALVNQDTLYVVTKENLDKNLVISVIMRYLVSNELNEALGRVEDENYIMTDEEDERIGYDISVILYDLLTKEIL